MRELAVSPGLNDQQRQLVHLIVHSGKGIEEAGDLAGYAPRSVYGVLKNPAVAHAISLALQTDIITVGAPLAYRVAKSLLKDEKVQARVRADLAIKLLDRAGHTTPTKGEKNAPQKALSEMNRDELAAFIDTNQAALERAEDEAVRRALDVSAPAKAPDLEPIDVKPLSFLD